MAARTGRRKPPMAKNGDSSGVIPDYEEVFGGPPRFSEHLHSLGEGEYEEIFGGVMSSCTIPFIDLSTSSRGTNRGAVVNYDEIFGGCSEFAIPYEVLLPFPRRNLTTSSSVSGIKESDASQKITEGSEISPDIDFVAPAQKDHLFSEEHLRGDGIDGVQHPMADVLEEFGAKLDYSPSIDGVQHPMADVLEDFGAKLDYSPSKAKASSFFGYENGSDQAGTPQIASTESSIKSYLSDVQEMKVKISEELSVNGKSDSHSSRYHSMNGNTSLADFSFLSVSGISVNTQSNQVLPPFRRPPPKGVNRKGHPSIKMNKSLKYNIDEENSSRETVDHGNQEQDLDKVGSVRHSEVDASLDASTSAVTMKEAIDQVQAKLKSAKQLLGRTREHVPVRKNLQSQQGIIMEGKKDHVVHETRSRSIKTAENWETLLKEDEEIAELLAIQRQNSRRKSRDASGSESHEDGPKEGVKFEDRKFSSNNNKNGEQKTGKALFELFKNDDDSSMVKKSELKLKDESATIKSLKTDMELNDEKVSASDMAKMSYEVKRTRKMWAINEIHEYNEEEENEMNEILTAIRAARGEEDTKDTVEEEEGISSPEDCTKPEVDIIHFGEGASMANDTEEHSTWHEAKFFRSSPDCYIQKGETDLKKDNEKRASFDRNSDEWSDDNISTFGGNKIYNYLNLEDEISTPTLKKIEHDVPIRCHEPRGEDALFTHYYSDSEECENRSEEAEMKCFPDENKIDSMDYMEFVGVDEILAVDELEDITEDVKLVKKSRPAGENFELGKAEADFIQNQTEPEAEEEAYQHDENDYEGEEKRIEARENEANKESTQIPFELESRKSEITEEDHEHGNKKFVDAHLGIDPEIEYSKINASNFFQASDKQSEVGLPGKKVDKPYSVDISWDHTSACEKTNVDASERMERKEDEAERMRKLEEEKEREREREKDRAAVEKATREARQRLLAESREKAERAAVERITAEAWQRALAEAREKSERASAEALKKSLEKAKLRAERAAVERATAEARERAMERAVAERSSMNSRDRGGQFNVPSKDKMKKDDDAGDSGTKIKPSSSEGLNSNKHQSPGSSSSFHKASNGNMEGVVSESALRRKSALARHQRTVERAAKALAEKNMRDIVAQREQAERNRLSESLDAEVKRWSVGKEGNLRALLSTLQYVLGPNSGWQPIPLTEMVTAAAVKKAYRKATLCVHPDKLQQRRAGIQQKYICEKVFDLLKEAWNKFNSEER